MTIKRILAVILIFCLGVAGWVTLGSISIMRGGELYSSMDHEVQQLWGSNISQKTPELSVNIPGSTQQRILTAASNQIDVELQLEQRKKGLIWYPTYTVNFKGVYTIKNPDAVSQNVRLHIPLPSEYATYDQFSFMIDDKVQDLSLNTKYGVHQIIELAAGQTRSFTLSYRTRGMRDWYYELVGKNGRVKDLDLKVSTNFSELDYGSGSLSPMSVKTDGDVTRLHWQADDLITRKGVHIILPEKLNPGPLAAEMTYFAPVCLLFFFILITALCVIKRINIHPMHYLFVTGGFFAYHLLFAYLIDVINLHFAFAISSLVSVSLVTFYLKNALSENFPWRIAMIGQLFYLVLFSYSFFIEGMTGLTVTVGSILTLAILMKLTAKMDWAQVFMKQVPAKQAGVVQA